jgi:2-hydroxychromene-2-carboxylate isomerase
MGEVIRLADCREPRAQRTPARERPLQAEFFFDLGCPLTYLTAERVDRAFDQVTWVPACATALRGGPLSADPAAAAAMRATAEARAAALRLPLAWPERWPGEVPAAMRVAHYAAQAGRGGAFVLAATRLAFAGGFDLDDPELITEAAAAAGLAPDACLQAAGEVRRDGAIESAARRLLSAGADRLPALVVDRALYWGEDRVTEATAAARRHDAAIGRRPGA